jgi:tyrosine-protein kinase Etk/Wzc
MNHLQVSLPAASPFDDGEFRLLDLLIVITRYKKLILGVSITALLTATAVCFFLPDRYVASAQLLPPQKKTSGAIGLLSQIGGVGAIVGISSLKTPASLHIGMLKSRILADTLSTRFDLQALYGTDTAEETRRTLARHTRIAANKHGLITLKVEADDKALAAQLANAYIEELKKLERQMALDAAGQVRGFFQRELGTARQKLDAAEMAYKGTWDTGGLNSPAADTQSIAENIARLQGRISAQEVELDAMRAFVTGQNSRFLQEQEELMSLRQELGRLRGGASLAGDSAPGIGDDPQAGWQKVRLLREVNYYELLTDLLTRQYEAARLNAADDASQVQILDAAVEPEESPAPQRFVIVALGGLAGIIIGLSCAFVAEAQRRYVLDPKGSARWTLLRRHLASRWHG